MSVPARRPRASIFFFDGWISISVSVVGAATELLARGYDVDLFFNRPQGELPSADLPAGIALHEYVPWTRRLTGKLLSRLRRRKLEELSKITADDNVRKKSARLRALAKAVLGLIEIPQFALYCRRHARKTDLAIAFDMNSLVAMDFALPRATPFIYWSLEIWRLTDLADPFSRAVKRHEIRRLGQALAVVVQSPVRRAIIEEDLPAPLPNYVEVPNAPSVPMPASLQRDFYSRRFPIPPGAWVVLHSGFISTSLMSLEIAKSVPSWPEEFVLVFHERQPRDPQEPYLRAVQQAGGARTFLSLKPVPFAEVDNVYAGAHIGLVCYQTAEVNEATAWASSGKLVYYLRHGLPIIVIMPECPPILSECRCGEWVSDFDGIGPALARIAADYDSYAARARATYDKLFNFHGAFDRLMQAVGHG
ncbi:MAG: hypothetical protein BGN85_06735 [Alphaproteobacteria bacterium 64-11]|nr:hypothetical protein [Alphaproteobacteria bacterium]OJU13040.1 MAG: hypothetical protein BGN85_06735 [Alphaproteobacteria bacterium 64-11]